jgi:hypothetical protein
MTTNELRRLIDDALHHMDQYGVQPYRDQLLICLARCELERRETEQLKNHPPREARAGAGKSEVA